MIAWLLHLWTTPSAFADDWRGYLLNQLGHGYLIGGLPVLIWPEVFPWHLAAYAIAVEWVQHRYRGAAAWDCLDDLAHVALVASAAALATWWLLVPNAIRLAAGARMRAAGALGSPSQRRHSR